MSREGLLQRIANLNANKDEYARNKLKNKHTNQSQKDLAADTIYVVSSLQAYATSIGIDTKGHYTEETPVIAEFKKINTDVINLQTQIVQLFESTPEQLCIDGLALRNANPSIP